jgi:hypothetical protein
MDFKTTGSCPKLHDGEFRRHHVVCGNQPVSIVTASACAAAPRPENYCRQMNLMEHGGDQWQ